MASTGARASRGFIAPQRGVNTRTPFDHQKAAMAALDAMNKLPEFSTMVVLPTGGGKTFTASNWLLKNAVNNRKKILWIAHRHLLLDQAAESFAKYAFADLTPDINGFSYRVVSGLPAHGKAVDIRKDDDLLIASKDSLRSRPDKVREWLKGEDEVFVVVDEAHHATAKTYRSLIDVVKGAVPHAKIIGLTATPFRTLETEKGLLSKIFTDGIVDGRVVQGDSGIAYQIGLQDLINRQILSRPIMDMFQTRETFGQMLGEKELENMQRLDSIPDKVAAQMVENRTRNKLIVDTYAEDRAKYGKTILFAVNIAHAVTLQGLLEERGVKADYVVSQLKDDETGRSRTRDENERAVEGYRNGDVDVLINVNILTEGVDLPQTQSVFLARPTASTILMTQMIGRALRGVKSGGTAESHIVSFVDDWDEKVSWVNPESLFSGNGKFADADPKEQEREDLRTIALSKIREFANVLDATVDTAELEAIPFLERIPLGMYVFTYTERGEADDSAEGSDVQCQVMVYNSTKDAYERFIEALPTLVSAHGLDDEEFAPKPAFGQMVEEGRRAFFRDSMVPPFRKQDIASILKYYLQFGAAPSFYSFDTIDRNRLDIGAIASEIVASDMNRREEAEYEKRLWDEGEDNLLRLFFGNQRNFIHAIDMEVRKLTNPEQFEHVPTFDPNAYRRPWCDAESAESGGDAASFGEKWGIGSKGDVRNERTAGLSKPEGAVDSASLSPLVRVGRESYLLDELKISEETQEQLARYTPSGFAVNPRTGMPIKKFGGHARLAVFGEREALYSYGFRVAEFADGAVRLLEYEIDGEPHGWRRSRHGMVHVQDYVATRLGLPSVPDSSYLEKLSASVLALRSEAVGGFSSSGPLESVGLDGDAPRVEKADSVNDSNATKGLLKGEAVGSPTASGQKKVSPSSGTAVRKGKDRFQVPPKGQAAIRAIGEVREALKEIRSLPVRDGGISVALSSEAIAYVQREGKRACTIHDVKGRSYECAKYFDSLENVFLTAGFIRLNKNCIARPSAIEAVHEGKVDEVTIRGKSSRAYVTKGALRILRERCPKLFKEGEK